jgi:hypothetical protein
MSVETKKPLKWQRKPVSLKVTSERRPY